VLKMNGSARKQKEWLKGVAQAAAKAQGGGTPSKLESSIDDEEDKDEEEGEIIFPRSPLPENLHSPGDSFGR
jgi:hypothetical protein